MRRMGSSACGLELGLEASSGSFYKHVVLCGYWVLLVLLIVFFDNCVNGLVIVLLFLLIIISLVRIS